MFANAGYDKTSVRDIAAGAGVDPALIRHYFGSKVELFRATMGWPLCTGAGCRADRRGRSR
jgi:AcrR family transcriptional regulator